MPTKVIMPQLGESVVEGTVSRWLKSKGDRIEQYEPLLEVSTDKVDTEVPAPASGVLIRIHVKEGETVETGTLLAEIGESDTQPDVTLRPAHTNGTRTAKKATYSGHVTPVVARMVAEHDIDLGQLTGTGHGGRITKKDVEAYLEQQDAPVMETPAWEQPVEGDLFKPTVEYEDESPDTPVRSSSPAPTKASPATPSPKSAPRSVDALGEVVTLTPLRQAIAEHMVRSKLHTAPHVTTLFEIDMSAVMTHRAAHQADFLKQGVKLTLTAYFAAATVTALQENPYLNAQWTDEGIFLHHVVHLGVAVAIDGGLIVPVIRQAQDLNLMGIARAVNDLAQRAREKQLKPDEIQGGTFTITNHGVSGSLLATPIINQPQAGILGVGLVEKSVKVINDAIAIRPCCYVTLTFDHRIADGATGDAFMVTLKKRLENWA
ncbi:MAG: 2-oxo acid dehydrogenase subunit E2 [Anaerolineae bacterium]|nr:2-oxo acid dehydrogenase subunit E2 [Anaerolineae bacterium]